MTTTDQVQVHECCLVPVRLSRLGIEFCLTTQVGENRWEFPKASLDELPGYSPQVLERIAQQTGLEGVIFSREPLGQFTSSRHNEWRSMTSFLMRVERVAGEWPGQNSHKRLWCLAEEARVRIRRKPLRHFIDLALHCLADAEHNGQAR